MFYHFCFLSVSLKWVNWSWVEGCKGIKTSNTGDSLPHNGKCGHISCTEWQQSSAFYLLLHNPPTDHFSWQFPIPKLSLLGLIWLQLHDKALDEEHRFFDFTLKSVYWLCTSCIFHIKDVMEHKCREILVLCISCLQGRFLDFFNGVWHRGGKIQ